MWAIARRHNIRPVLPEDNLNKLAKMFDRSHFNIDATCCRGFWTLITTVR
jgi:hypothetical protein